MRILRKVICVVVLVSAVTTAALAAPATGVGYIPLASQSQAEDRLAAREAYRALLPALIKAHRDGAVLAFRPLFSVGLVRVEYAPDADLSGLRAGTVYPTAGEAIASLAVRPHSAMSPEFAGPFFTVYLDGCYGGENVGDTVQIFGTVYDARGRAIATSEDRSDTSGRMGSCFDDWGFRFGAAQGGGGVARLIQAGHRVVFKIYSEGEGWLGTYSATVPAFGFSSIDNARSIVRGTGPKGKSYQVDWVHYNLDLADTSVHVVRTGVVSAQGTWARDLGTVRMRGWDALDFYVGHSSSFAFAAEMNVPGFDCESATCYASGFPFANDPLVLTHGGVEYSFQGLFPSTPDGNQVYFLKDDGGNPIRVVAGDQVKVGNLPAETVPKVTAKINYGLDLVTGQAPKSGLIWLNIFDFTAETSTAAAALSTAAGTYTFDLGGIWDLVTTHAYRIRIYRTSLTTGNGFVFSFLKTPTP
jgi:hypothetical protein